MDRRSDPNGQVSGVPIQVPPGPVPTQVIVQQGEVNGQPCVILTILTPTGSHITFLPADVAKKVAQDILTRATPVTIAGLQPKEWR